jgi:hypothetical protein
MFTDTDLIFAYSRAQAIADGELIDVTATAREAGFVIPVAVTRALWADIVAIPARWQGIQDVDGRLWDVLWMGRAAAIGAGSTSELVYTLLMHVGEAAHYQVKMIIGPGDAGEPVITLMQPDES